jgi:hypothetical protein
VFWSHSPNFLDTSRTTASTQTSGAIAQNLVARVAWRTSFMHPCQNEPSSPIRTKYFSTTRVNTSFSRTLSHIVRQVNAIEEPHRTSERLINESQPRTVGGKSQRVNPHVKDATVRRQWCHVLRWIHTYNIAAYRNAVTLQVTDMLRSYDLNFHPVAHAVQYPASVTPWGSQFVTGARNIMKVK